MSFTTDVKEELAHKHKECSHCARATLAALMRIEGSLYLVGPQAYRVELSVDLAPVARLIINALHEVYGARTELVVRRSVLHKTPNYLIKIQDQPCMRPMLEDLGILTQDGLAQGIVPHLIQKSCCQAAFLRGVFLGSGFVAHPKGDFHFEMVLDNENFAHDVVQLINTKGIEARLSHRKNVYTVYLKKGSAIHDFLALVGAHQAALCMQNERVIKSLRNDVNRRVNAELANQAKAAQSSIDQILKIKKVLKVLGPEVLSPALKDYIKLRIAHPDATLKELGECASPPLSKSAIYHRVRRIEELAAKADAQSADKKGL